tara:strand:+ start:147 stop:551 length:405 start_codon:yes stop_codon:yes gene_type:complete
MATTTATITLASSDLLSDELALTTTATLTQAGNATGLTLASGLSRKKLASGHAEYTLYDGDDYTAAKAHKVFVKNTSTTPAEFFKISINSEEVGSLYAGDWAFFPWTAHDADNDIKIDPSADDMVLEHMLLIDE